MVKSGDPDQILQSMASNLGLHCFLRPVCPNTKGYYGKLQIRCFLYCIDIFLCLHENMHEIQSTLVISNFKGLTEILRDIRTSTYQS